MKKNDAEQRNFVAEIHGKKGYELADTLEQYENETIVMQDKTKSKNKTLFRAQRQQIVAILKDLAIKNPSMTLAQLVQLQARQSLKMLIQEQMAVVEELELFMQNYLNDEELLKGKIITEEYKNQINGKSDVQFKRKNFIHALSNVSSDPKKQNTIDSIISKLPTSDTGVDSFFVKYSQAGRTSREIATRLISQSKPTAEHLVPKSKGGKNNTANYICDCATCNSTRGTTSFSQWLQEKPEMAQNLQEYLEHVQQALDSGELPPEYDGYIEEIIQTLEKLSNGKLSLKMPETVTDEKQKAQILKRKATLDEIQEKVSKLYIERKALKSEIATLEANPQFRNIVQYQILQAQIKDVGQKATKASQELNALKLQASQLKTFLSQVVDFEENYAFAPHLYDREDIMQQTKGKTSQEIKDEIDVNSQQQEVIRQRLTILDAQYEELDAKRQVIATLGLPIEELGAKIAQQKHILDEINSLISEISQLKDSIFDEELLAQRLADIFSENLDLISDNQIYAQFLGEKPNKEKFDRYKKLDSLYELAQSMQDNRYKEVSQIAQDSIVDMICDISEDDSVKFYANEELLAQNSSEEEIIAERMSEIQKIKERIASLQQRLNELTNGRTLEDINEEYNGFLKQQDEIDRIKDISSLRSSVGVLDDTIAYNRSILKQLKDYRNMSNEEFRRLISLVY